MQDMLWIFLWLLGGVGVFVILASISKLVMWWLSKHPKIARVFVIVFGGLGGASIACVASALFTFFEYSFRGGTRLLGMDRGAFIILAASIGGFIVGTFTAFLFSRRLLQKQRDCSA